MNYRLKKVAVLGSGVMGSGIACHLANVGMEVLILDILPKDAKKDKDSRNFFVNNSLQNAIKSKPAPLYSKSFINRIKTGNFYIKAVQNYLNQIFVAPIFLIQLDIYVY